ncbi:MAG TPA: putative toxin-antitoxin system toxin component, PIN family [Candidatus Anoxymicrobiaceae bacterium]
MRVVADTNVFLSALIFGGPPEEIISLARQGLVELLVSADILLELSSVLKTKFEWQDARIADAVRSIGYCSILIKPETVIKKIRDDADNRVLECALDGDADFIITGDHHLLDLKSFQGIRILKARELLDIITES